MNKTTEKQPKDNQHMKSALKHTKEIKYQESPIERALKLSSDEAIARAIKDLIDRDRLN